MVLTKTQAEQFKNGTLTKSNFKKVLYTVDFEDYLYRYCKIVNDFRNEYLGNFYRITNFSVFNYHIIVTMVNGEFDKMDITTI
jgi:hypothetical protein